MNFEETLSVVTNQTIYDALVKAKQVINNYDNVAVSISGGADSDVMLDIIERVKDPGKKINYVWFNTGLEYTPTKEHIKELEKKYGIQIEEYKPVKPIPVCIKEFGIPFLNKRVSEYIRRLQARNFQWEDEPYEVLIERYPNTIDALKWWCNISINPYTGKYSTFCIGYNKYLKEFLMKYPPTFPISSRCCDYAKKKVGVIFNKEHDIELNCTGLRRSEGGRRANLKTCYTTCDNKYDEFRPILWFVDDDKREYENLFNIIHSNCYTVWGLRRTGCCGCPFAREIDQDLEIIKQYEPKLYNACINLFGKSYEYTRKYKEFAKMMREKNKNEKRIN